MAKAITDAVAFHRDVAAFRARANNRQAKTRQADQSVDTKHSDATGQDTNQDTNQDKSKPNPNPKRKRKRNSEDKNKDDGNGAKPKSTDSNQTRTNVTKSKRKRNTYVEDPFLSLRALCDLNPKTSDERLWSHWWEHHMGFKGNGLAPRTTEDEFRAPQSLRTALSDASLGNTLGQESSKRYAEHLSFRDVHARVDHTFDTLFTFLDEFPARFYADDANQPIFVAMQQDDVLQALLRVGFQRIGESILVS
jgi:flagellar biosynthesis GTPase FlhF